MIIFDFDKTLIDRDTLFGFYKAVNKPGISFSLKRLLLVVSAVLYKLKILSNTQLKNFGVYLFLKGKSKAFIEEAGVKYAYSLHLNRLYLDEYQNIVSANKVVITASLGVYIRPLFLNEQTLCSELEYKRGIVRGLGLNCFSGNKLKAFNSAFPEHKIEAIYTDSYSDISLMNHADKVYIVKNGKIT